MATSSVSSTPKRTASLSAVLLQRGIPLDGGNLVLKARDALHEHAQRALPPVAIHLEKNLPIASGIGGGSSDAAATLLALDALWGLGLGFEQLAAMGLTLGADLPMCLHGASKGTPLAARGIGESLTPVAGLPAVPMLLVNDGTAVATPDVFRALDKRDHPALKFASHADIAPLCAYLETTRNDLLPPALKLAPRSVTNLTCFAQADRFMRRCPVQVRPVMRSLKIWLLQSAQQRNFPPKDPTGSSFRPIVPLLQNNF